MEFARGAAVDLGPARPDHRADARHAAGAGREHEQRPVGGALLGADQQPGDRRDRDQGGGTQNAALPVPVDEAGDLRAQDGGCRREGGGEGAREPVRPCELGNHGDDADAHHGQRHPAEEAGGGERLGAWGGENRAVRTGQGMLR